MSIQFHSNSPTPVGAAAAQPTTAAPLAALMMAPVELTPLAPPASAASVASSASAMVSQDAHLAAETRQTCFTERQKALLERLQQSDAAPTIAPRHPLPEAQRQICVAVLATVAAAVAAR